MDAYRADDRTSEWPYEHEEIEDPPRSGPTWECPDGTCECHSFEETGEPLELTVLLCDDRARPIPGARCRVLQGGHTLHDAPVPADGEGWLSLTVQRRLRTVTLEWAPPELPLGPRYPYRMRWHVDIKPEDDRTSIKRRLHNLGFSQRGSLRENVKDFQRAFGHERLTGEVEAIRADLVLFHDRGWIPPIEDEPEDGDHEEDEGDVRTEEGQGGSAPFQAFPGAVGQTKPRKAPKPRSVPVPRPEKPKKHKPAGGPPGAGVARPVPRGKLALQVCCQFATLDRHGDVDTRCRWDEEDTNPHPVAGASIELFDTQANVVAVFAQANRSTKTGTVATDRDGQRELKIGGIPDGRYVLRLNPPAGHELRGPMPGPITTEAIREAQLRSVGPDDEFPGDPAGHRRFRLLEIEVTLKSGALVEAAVAQGMRRPGDVAFHGAVVDRRPAALKVDWRPDWVRCRFTAVKEKQRDPSREGKLLSKVQFIVLHHTDADTPGSTINEFCDEKNKFQTGAHYLVDVDGHVVKMAHETTSVRHAGRCFWYGLDSYEGSAMERAGFNWNDISVGIEQVHSGTSDYKAPQIAGTKNLVERIRKAHGTSHHNVLGHGEISLHPTSNPKRLGHKVTCPGASYPWAFLERSGNAALPGSGVVPHARYAGFFQSPNASISVHRSSKGRHPEVAGLQATLSELGYFVNGTGELDEPTVRAVEAFHNRYFAGERRPETAAGRKVVKQVVDLATIEMMHNVLAARAGFRF